jgi:hypothetical protein
MRRLLAALMMIALLAVVAAAPIVAKDAGKSDCKNGGWTAWVRTDGSVFVDQGSCVGYVAGGGVLMRPTTGFQSTCVSAELGGSYHEWISAYGVSAGPACTWTTIEIDPLNAAAAALEGYCTAPSVRITYRNPENGWGLVGCMLGEG